MGATATGSSLSKPSQSKARQGKALSRGLLVCGNVITDSRRGMIARTLHESDVAREERPPVLLSFTFIFE